MKKVHLPWRFRLLPLWLPWILITDKGLRVTATTLPTTVLPENRVDAISTYRVYNWHQCQRLCWYRPLCTSFSHTASNTGAINCVLHSNQMEGTVDQEASPTQWTETAASRPSGSAATTGCGVRSCDHFRGMCIPRSDGGSNCYNLSIECGQPNPVANADVTAPTSRDLGSKAMVSCHQNFVQSPKDTPMDIECQANGRWTSFPGECVQAVFHNPPQGVSRRIPWSLTPGWKACMEGVFDGQDRMTFNFKDADGNVMPHVDFRRQWMNDHQLIVVSSSVNGSWQETADLIDPPMTLSPGENFTLTFEVTSSVLRLTLNNDVYEVATSALGLDLTGTRYLQHLHDCLLLYLNLAGDCSSSPTG